MKKFSLIFLTLLFGFQLFADNDDDKQKLAVMEFEDLSGKLSRETLAGATEYMRGAFVSTNKYVVIAKERQEKAMIKEMKKESYKSCNDKNCQIPLGQALSADTILRTTISFFGGVYVITSELIDLAKEATVSGAKEKCNGTEESFMEAIDKITAQIAETAVQHTSDSIKIQEKPKSVKTENIQQNQGEKKSEIMEKPKKTATYHPYKKAGISLMVVGAAVVVGGVSGFHFASDTEYDEYKKFKSSSKAQNYASLSKYKKDANTHRNLSNTFRILEITSGAVGGAALITGIVLTAVKKEKQRNISLTNISVTPSNEGFYASIGFDF